MSEHSRITKLAKKVCPAVITIVVSKDLPKVEGFYMFPFGGQDVVFPMIKGEEREKTKIGGGSGFIVSPDGLVLTSCHIINDPKDEYTVILEPDKKYPAKILARDQIDDIALLKIDGQGFPHIRLGDSDRIELGQSVVAIGNALGEFHDTLSAGIISGLSRIITAGSPFSMQAERLRGLIQTDAAINPGNSGGPLVDLDGKVIGINTAMVMGAQSIGFAIPINYAKKILDEVKKYGRLKTPFLGVRYILLSKEITEKNKLPVDYGAFVVRENLGESAIVKGSAADKADIKEFDIILEINNEKINVENPLAHILQKFKSEEEINLKILREGQEIIVKVKLEEKDQNC
jgi:serine protease Do